MEVLSLTFFFGFLVVVFLFRNAILNNALPKLFNLNILLSAFVVIGVAFSLAYFIADIVIYSTSDKRLLFGKIDYNSNYWSIYLDTLYFSFISQLTVGYGDIHPVHSISKVASIIQGIFGAIFMGGLVAALIEKSKSALNYLYVSGIHFYHSDAASNHGHEIFNMDLRLQKTDRSLFGDFKINLFAEYDGGKRFLIITKENKEINSKDQITFDVSQKNMYPKFISEHGRLLYETLNPKLEKIGPNGLAGGPEKFQIPMLVLQYEYSFESKIYLKEIVVNNTNSIAAILTAPGRSETDWVSYEQH